MDLLFKKESKPQTGILENNEFEPETKSNQI